MKARTPGDGADENKRKKGLSTTNCEESEVCTAHSSWCVYASSIIINENTPQFANDPVSLAYMI